MELLSIKMESEHLLSDISLIYNMDLVINHLIYADDILIFSKANLKSATTIKSIFTNL